LAVLHSVIPLIYNEICLTTQKETSTIRFSKNQEFYGLGFADFTNIASKFGDDILWFCEIYAVIQKKIVHAPKVLDTKRGSNFEGDFSLPAELKFS